jgi:type IV pilus assembly protein PilW
MATRAKHRPTRGYQRGLTLIELMISITLGLLTLSVTTAVFLGVTRTARTQDEASRVDDTGRFALESIARVIRQAGYRNWGGPQNTPPGYAGSGDFVIDGADGSAANVGYSDTINVRYVGSGNSVGSADGSIVDCLGNPVPEAAGWSDRVVNTFTVALNGSVRELRCNNGSGAVTLATNIDGLQFLYGLDIAGDDRVPDRWASAAAVGTQWDKVVAVRVSLMAVGTAGSRGLDADTLTYRMFDEDYVDSSDLGTTYDASTQTADARSRLRKVYTTTIFLRNRTFGSGT